jgi:hypothetical protein
MNEETLGDPWSPHRRELRRMSMGVMPALPIDDCEAIWLGIGVAAARARVRGSRLAVRRQGGRTAGPAACACPARAATKASRG